MPIAADAPTRIAPAAPPYAPEVDAALAKMMGARADLPPLALFRTLVRHFPLSERMRPLAAGLLAHGALEPADRELLILRTCARCGCEYEWGVHEALFGRAVGLSDAARRATAQAPGLDPAWGEREALLVALADALHDGAAVPDPLWAALAARWTPEQLLEMLVVAGFYHLVSFVANGARVPREPWAPRLPGSPPG